MKLLHTSDWHIGQQFFSFSREEEHLSFFSQLADIVGQERPDIMVVSGDVFHTSTPAADALRLFVDGLLSVCRRHPAMRTIVTAGNHDSAMRIEADKALWEAEGVSIVGVFQRNEEGQLDPNKFVKVIPGVAIVAAVPYISPRFADYGSIFCQIEAEVERLNADGLPVVYMAHTATGMVDDGVGGVDTVPLEKFGHAYDYLALGHIHMPQTIKQSEGRARYCGSPIAISFDETHPHGVDIVEIGRHGSALQISTVKIHQTRGVLTLPKSPAPLSDVLSQFEALPADCTDYVRLNVLVEDYLPADTQERAAEIANDKKCRLCQIMSTPKHSADSQQTKAMTLSEFNVLTPFDIAQKEYRRRHDGTDMPTDIAELLRDVIASVEADKQA